MKGVPLRGGMVTSRDAAQLESGSFSAVVNLRPKHPGFEKRPGQRVLHTSADSTNQVMSLYQLVKNQISESAVFAQMSDGDILKAAASPPTVTTGAFGDEIFSGNASPKPASWAHVNDILAISTGVDQHKLYAGSTNYVKKFIVYSSDATARSIPVTGVDNTEEVIDGLSTTVSLAGIGADADNALYICTPIPANKITFTVTAANTTTATATLKYRKSDNTWASASATDGTASGGKTLAVTGSFTWTFPADEIPWMMYGTSGYWYQITFGAGDLAVVTVSAVTYGTDGTGSGTRTSVASLENVWDGIMVDAIEARVGKDYSTTGSYATYYTYGSSAVSLGDIALDENDAIFISSFDPIMGIYVDVGDTPNTDTTSAAALTSISYWDGNAWQAFSSVVDYTVADANALTFAQSGWILFPKNTADKPQMLGSTEYYAHWYKIILDDAITTDVVAAFYTMPWFKASEMGYGVSCCSWGNRMCYASNRWGQYIYVTKLDTVNVLNGADYSVLEAGDGRTNQILAMERFYNELIAWQEEKGIEGGCTTLFEGYNPSTYGKLVLSSKIGIINAKCRTLVEGVLTSTATDETLKTLCFWVSRYGVCVTDGRTVSIISDAIQNYFDPTKTECIRKGYENQHWMAYDSAFNILRIGIVSGASATVPNKFFCFDLVDKCWYEDTLGQALSCATDVEAGSGNAAVLQIGGGTADGTVYQLNYGTNDISTAVASYLDIEFQYGGIYLVLLALLLRCKVQTAGDVTLTVYANKVSQFSETLSMLAEDTSEVVRRNMLTMNVINHALSLRLAHSTASQSMTLYELGVTIGLWNGR